MSTISAPCALYPRRQRGAPGRRAFAVPVTQREIVLHGQRVTFLEAGADCDGPVVVLLHGLASSSRTWSSVLPLLGRHAHVIAPDLLGHGQSAKPRTGDYSLGAYATELRDLLLTLGLDQATIVGHSFGGGVAMQFAHQFPEMTERLVLEASGGLGQGVTIALRAATLPGTPLLLRALSAITPPWLAKAVHWAMHALPTLNGPDLDGLASAFASFTDDGARGAFAQTVRGALDWSGQRLGGLERLYLLADVPVLLIGGNRDSVIPFQHTVSAHDLLPGSRLEIFDGAGHFPHTEQPRRFADLLAHFLITTHAAHSDLQSLRRRLQSSSPTGCEPPTEAERAARSS
ncbi:alpha/beta fold hydrolase [Pseudonocardia alaniniphila]|uniref:Alpha/beta hydrolase n=1 Tax=Pseudonocardia alaniniphila TaxID=75291 RepID=A0ABS9TR34_9PSEU|nr:alpha/beta hydrolase [Pseudonocardia alaniniphila]MCH6171004.1 alpha/beta hydrolase [Pseudonocardia alaniniphila]